MPVCWGEAIRHMIKIAFKYGKKRNVGACIAETALLFSRKQKKNVPLLSKIILQVLFFANLSWKLAKTIQGMPKYLEYMYLDGARGFPLVSKTFPGFCSLGVQNFNI